MLPNDTIYKFNVENLRFISTSIEQIKRTTHHAIASEDEILVQSFTRLFALVLGTWAETRLRKLHYEPNGFNDADRALLNGESSQINKWSKSIEIAVRKHYNIQTGPLNNTNLPHSTYSRYQTLQDILENHLKPVIEIRNKLAHGQWVFQFTDSMDLSVPHKTAIENVNVLSLQFKHLLLKHLSQIVHDLTVSKPTFERDFDKNFQKFVGVHQNLENRSYQNYVSQLKERFLRGKQKKENNIKNNV